MTTEAKASTTRRTTTELSPFLPYLRYAERAVKEKAQALEESVEPSGRALWLEAYNELQELRRTLASVSEWQLLGAPHMIAADYHTAKDRTLVIFERAYISWVLYEAGGNISKAARMAGVDRSSMYRIIRRHDIATGDSGEKEAAALFRFLYAAGFGMPKGSGETVQD